jgi:hypothetical protein
MNETFGADNLLTTSSRKSRAKVLFDLQLFSEAGTLLQACVKELGSVLPRDGYHIYLYLGWGNVLTALGK